MSYKNATELLENIVKDLTDVIDELKDEFDDDNVDKILEIKKQIVNIELHISSQKMYLEEI